MEDKKKEKSGLQKLAEMFGGLTEIAVEAKSDRTAKVQAEVDKATGSKKK